MKLAIIGGSLCGSIQGFAEDISEEHIKTPFGDPSDACVTAKINQKQVVYLNRHARSHHIAPHQINYRANMFMLKILEVTHVIAVTAVGGISEKMSPMRWVIPDQLIDYTHGRMQTYNDGNDDNEVMHIDFTHPFDPILGEKLQTALSMENIQAINRATYGVTQGPRLETAAEILRKERDGCDIVGMTAMPEAALARELDMSYATLSLVVNWAAGKGGSESMDSKERSPQIISMDEIRQRIADGNRTIENIINNFISVVTDTNGI